MGFFDKLKNKFKKKENETLDIQKNEYYKNDNADGSVSYFTYIYDDVVPGMNKNFKLHLQIGKSVDVGESKAYECILSYGKTGGPSLMDNKFADDIKGFEKVLLCIDKKRMILDQNYAEFVFSKLLSFDRIKKLHDIQYGLIEGRKSGNYVGSVIENNGNLVTLMDHNIGDVVNVSYNNLSFTGTNSESDINKTIQLLRAQRDEIRNLSSDSENEYQSGRTR